MDLSLSKHDLAIQARAKEFAEKHLFPHEIATDERKISKKTLVEIRKQAIAYKLNGYNHTEEDGGYGYTPLQADAYLRGTRQGDLRPLDRGVQGLDPAEAWHQVPARDLPAAVQCRQGPVVLCHHREGRGLGPDYVKTSAVKKKGKWVINGEKWFVTSADASSVVIVHAHVDGDAKKPTLFIVDIDAPGVKVKRIPQFMHSYVYEHYEMVFDNVTVDDNRRLGEVGQGFDLTKEWFTETRIEIAAHCLGAAIRAAEIANAYAAERVQFGKAIRDFQAIEFMLADMAVEIMAAKSLLYRIAAEVTGGMDPKLVHARASAVKLYNSEMAGGWWTRHCRSWAGAAICGRTRSSGSTAMSGWTGSGRALPRSSAW